jgi:FkbM family methyltransferase
MAILKKLFFGKHARISYSQCGEDLIMSGIFGALKIKTPSYIDIGAHDASYLSNTYLYYLNGSSGLCIEPNPHLLQKFKRKRKRDICLNVGVGITSANEAPFYVMTSSTLSSFSKKEAERLVGSGHEKIKKVINLPLISFNEAVETYLKKKPNLVSLDVEGLDLEILKSIDFSLCRPEVFCVETLTYMEDGSGEKITPIIEFMLDNGYFVYADTWVNTIFVDRAAWKGK